MARYAIALVVLTLAAVAAVFFYANGAPWSHSGSSTYAGLTRAEAHDDAVALIMRVSAKRQLGLAPNDLELLQQLRGKDADGQQVWKLDFGYRADASCVRVLMRATSEGRWLGRSSACT